MPKPSQAPAAEDPAADPAQGQADDPAQGQPAEPAAGEAKDYKALYEEALAQSRKWEKRSKDNLAELEGLKQSAPKQDPTLEERLAALEEENNSLKAAKARNALIDSVSAATGVDRSLVASLNGEDEEALTAQAEAIAAIAKPRATAPAAPEAGQKARAGKPSKRDILAIKDEKERIAAIRENIDLFIK